MGDLNNWAELWQIFHAGEKAQSTEVMPASEKFNYLTWKYERRDEVFVKFWRWGKKTKYKIEALCFQNPCFFDQ